MGFPWVSWSNDWSDALEELSCFFDPETTIGVNGVPVRVDYNVIKIGDGEGNYYGQ